MTCALVGVWLKIGPRLPCAGGVTIENVIGLPSASVAVMVTVTELSSFVVAEVLFATGGVLQVGTVSPSGSDGAAGEQVCVVVGKVPTGLPFVRKVVPEVEIVVQYVRAMVPCCAVGTPAVLPTGRTSALPAFQLSAPE